MKRNAYVYILASKRNGTLYVGVTTNLHHRIQQHKDKHTPGFTQKYNVTRLVYVVSFDEIHHAILFEKIVKNRPRRLKLRMIEEQNPDWEDLLKKEDYWI